MIYPSIRIEGAILSPDILDRLEDMPGQRPSEFGFQNSVKVKDEIAAAWADAQDFWRIFQRKLESLKADSPATTETRNLWMAPLFGLLGYQPEYQQKGIELNGKIYPISHRDTKRGNIPIHIIGYNEPARLDRKPERSALRMSAHAMLQEYLNLHDELYGIVTNGRVLRLLRDSSRLIKLSYIEFDLDRIFTDGLFADFAILYRLLHASRMPATQETAAESLIERYHQDSLDSGARIRDGLSQAVETAIHAFANGFLSHPANSALRKEIADGKLTPAQFYQYLLRLIYRLLFLLVIEERDLVYPLSAEKKQRKLYYDYYSLQRLRRLSEKRYLADARRHDLWLSLLSTFLLFEANGPGKKLGMAPLAGDLFNHDAIGPFNQCTLGNDVVLTSLRSLGLYQHPDSKQLIRVNYAALNVEEFGSVYEGLLEFEPTFIQTDNTIEFAFKAGDERSATGSHYTPDELVQPLIKHSLDYLIADKLKEPDPELALLSLRVADIACGSGHILLAAARRIATELAIVRTGEDQPSPDAFRKAVRDVICNCIYGVDYNPLAVELCKVALWLEAHSPGMPLNFLDHHIKCGNAIVGYVRRDDVHRGVPDEAFKTLPGDDKTIAAELRKRNKAERKDREKRQKRLDLGKPTNEQIAVLSKQLDTVSTMPEANPEQIEAKREQYEKYTKSVEAYELNVKAHIPLAQFYIPKTPENQRKVITDADFWRYWNGERKPQGEAPALAHATGERKRFFHWFLKFPEIVERGGFDCILGNPPYLGGQALSGTYGHPFCEYVKWEYAPTGLSDLVVFFLRRIHGLLRPAGFTAFITTNSIKDGDVRKDGLEQVMAKGASINMAVRGIRWPGRANLVVSLVAMHAGDWVKDRTLDNKPASFISAYFEDSPDAGDPISLGQNAASVFQGSIFLGDGFLLTHREAKQLVASDAKNSEVIYPLINGQELNNEPDQQPGRSIINFHDWPIEKAREYPIPFAIVEEKVKPDRAKQGDAGGKMNWWRFLRPRMEMYAGIAELPHCLVAAATTKYLNFSAAPTDRVFANTLYVFTTDRWDLFAVVQSTVHEVWARKYSGALETRLRYSPTDCFETFACPEGLWQTPSETLADIGERYHEHRRRLMLNLWHGLTNTYNLFHSPTLEADIEKLYAKRGKKPDWIEEVPEQHRAGAQAFTPEQAQQGILELRSIHVELDTAVLRAYGWAEGQNAVNLAHDFYEVETLPENDRTRYTISPEARKEVLKRLLTENHKRAAQEKAHGVPQRMLTATPKPPAEVKPFTIEDLPMLPDLAWQGPATRTAGDVLVALAAVLKAAKGPRPMADVRMATLLALEPRLLTPFLTPDEAKHWLRLIGGDAKPLPPGVMQMFPIDSKAWANAEGQLRATGRMLLDLNDQTWAPGEKLAELETHGWPDGRALMAVSVAERVTMEVLIKTLKDKKEDHALRFVNGEAA